MKKNLPFAGILLSAGYGLVFRVLGDINGLEEYYSLYSFGYLCLVPVIMGIIPFFFAKKEIARSFGKQALLPILSVIVFLLITLITRIEDLICVLILSFPYLLVAAITGLLVGHWIGRQDKKNLYPLLLIPLIFTPSETLLPVHNVLYEVTANITIEGTKEVVWSHLIEVPEIAEAEYPAGFFNLIGIPRPLKSQLETIDGQVYRMGYFSDGLVLRESIAEIDSFQEVHFDIHMDESVLRSLPMDEHILKSDFFHFTNISYHLEEISPTQTALSLKCNYEISSRLNSYANFWAEQVIRDFEEKLLWVLKQKVERTK